MYIKNTNELQIACTSIDIRHATKVGAGDLRISSRFGNDWEHIDCRNCSPYKHEMKVMMDLIFDKDSGSVIQCDSTKVSKLVSTLISMISLEPFNSIGLILLADALMPMKPTVET